MPRHPGRDSVEQSDARAAVRRVHPVPGADPRHRVACGAVAEPHRDARPADAAQDEVLAAHGPELHVGVVACDDVHGAAGGAGQPLGVPGAVVAVAVVGVFDATRRRDGRDDGAQCVAGGGQRERVDTEVAGGVGGRLDEHVPGRPCAPGPGAVAEGVAGHLVHHRAVVAAVVERLAPVLRDEVGVGLRGVAHAVAGGPGVSVDVEVVRSTRLGRGRRGSPHGQSQRHRRRGGRRRSPENVASPEVVRPLLSALSLRVGAGVRGKFATSVPAV